MKYILIAFLSILFSCSNANSDESLKKATVAIFYSNNQIDTVKIEYRDKLYISMDALRDGYTFFTGEEKVRSFSIIEQDTTASPPLKK